MSRKNKNLRAFLYQNPDATVEEAWDAAWANHQGQFASRKHEEQQARIAELQAKYDALEEGAKKVVADFKLSSPMAEYSRSGPAHLIDNMAALLKEQSDE